MSGNQVLPMEEDTEHRNSLSTTKSIWEQMSYIPPRGPCGATSSIISAPCRCLRFMVRPDALPTSFLCDGCNHHASYHEMRNKQEEAIKTRWTKEDGTFDREAYEADEEVQEVLAKRKRLGYHKPMYSSADQGHAMPEKAQRNLLEQGQRDRLEKGGDGSVSVRPEKRRKSAAAKTFEDFMG